MARAMVPNIQNWDSFVGFQIAFEKINAVCSDFKWVGLTLFRFHSKFGTFANWPLFDNYQSGCIRISDSHCSKILSLLNLDPKP